MRFFYNLGIYFYALLARIFALFSPKAKLFVEGREAWADKLSQQLAHLRAHAQENKLIWLHSASLGEFEQGRPVLEALREAFPENLIVLSFFSPSGFEVLKNYPKADLVCYLPLDTPKNAHHFVQLLKPSLALFVKYELWFNLLDALKEAEVPTVVFSAIFRPKQFFFKFYGAWARPTLQNITHFFVQNDESKQLLAQIKVEQTTVLGDTRFDRVWQIKQEAQPQMPDYKPIKYFKSNKPLLVLGSAWLPDIALWAEVFASQKFDFKLLIAPHELKGQQMAEMNNLLNKKAGLKSLFYTQKPSQEVLESSDVLFLDTIGMLSRVYQFADLAYVGGGFGVGIHNTLEAAVWGIPVSFGPLYKKFFEAVRLVELGIASSLSTPRAAASWLEVCQDKPKLNDIQSRSLSFFESQLGASTQIVNFCKKIIVQG
ncbi:MAG: 3-deoxy-D-manno-octulosonic acid transferase [Cytophagales bacterium]|nr:MAG: 3-deoxy-D-manno-octulosonic acid transferase [Cytophagales bacterium]TAF60415.1 MAG: 3-deoxy-D-manno-octulosonic acid transferase [Cytophagales bacterium]